MLWLAGMGLKRNFIQKLYGDNMLLGDSGYPQTAYMMTPLAEGTVHSRAEALYQESQIKSRNVIERAFGVWERRFPILSRGISIKLVRVPGIIVATAVLHNLAIQQNESVPPEDPEFPVLEEDFIFPPILPPHNQQRGTRNLERTALIEGYFARL